MHRERERDVLGSLDLSAFGSVDPCPMRSCFALHCSFFMKSLVMIIIIINNAGVTAAKVVIFVFRPKVWVENGEYFSCLPNRSVH